MADATETIFSRILREEIPSHRIWEDEHVYAFLDIGPLSRGHVLVIPKEACAFLHELSDSSAAAIGRALPRICKAVLAATGATAYNVIQNNGTLAHQEVMHVHFHVIPRYEDGTGLELGWKPITLENGEELAAEIASHLQSG